MCRKAEAGVLLQLAFETFALLGAVPCPPSRTAGEGAGIPFGRSMTADPSAQVQVVRRRTPGRCACRRQSGAHEMRDTFSDVLRNCVPFHL